MFRTDGQGNLFILSDNSGVITLKELPKKVGKLVAVFDGNSEVRKEFVLQGQSEVVIYMSPQDIRKLGTGEHVWYVDLISGDGKSTDTIVYQKIVVIDKEQVW